MKTLSEFMNEGKVIASVDFRSSKNTTKIKKELQRISDLRDAKFDGETDKSIIFILPNERSFDHFKRDVEGIKGANFFVDELEESINEKKFVELPDNVIKQNLQIHGFTKRNLPVLAKKMGKYKGRAIVVKGDKIGTEQ